MSKTVLERIALNIATLGPIGNLPKAPGTWGSAAALLLAPWLFIPFSTTTRALILLGILLVGALASTWAEGILEAKDPGCVIIDELLGQWTALLFLANATALTLLAGFVLFRLFDIAKPWPIKRVETIFPGGLGVMLDDVLAGLYAMAGLHILLLFI